VNKENIFEELNKMKNLMVAKSGKVISEQTDNVSGDVGTIIRELNNFDSDEQKIVNILKKYKDKASFKNFVDQYKTISGKDFGTDVRRVLTPGQDRVEIEDLKKHLTSIGVTMGDAPYDRSKFPSYTFSGLDGAVPTAVDASKVEEMWKGSKVSCVTTQPGVRQSKMKNGSTVYVLGKVVYYANGRKKLADGTMANYNCSTEFKSGNLAQSVNNRFTKSAESLGIQGGKMDLQTLQSILKTLEGEQSTPAVATSSTQGVPDLAQLTAALNQLNA
jgi:hypothetical protein